MRTAPEPGAATDRQDDRPCARRSPGALPATAPQTLATVAEQFEALAKEQARTPSGWTDGFARVPPVGAPCSLWPASAAEPWPQAPVLVAPAFLAFPAFPVFHRPLSFTTGVTFESQGVLAAGFHTPHGLAPSLARAASVGPPSSVAQQFEALARLHKAQADAEVLLSGRLAGTGPYIQASHTALGGRSSALLNVEAAASNICREILFMAEGFPVFKRRRVEDPEDCHSVLGGASSRRPSCSASCKSATKSARTRSESLHKFQRVPSSEESESSSSGTWVEEVEQSSRTEADTASHVQSSHATGDSTSNKRPLSALKRKLECIEKYDQRQQVSSRSAPESKLKLFGVDVNISSRTF